MKPARNCQTVRGKTATMLVCVCRQLRSHTLYGALLWRCTAHSFKRIDGEIALPDMTNSHWQTMIYFATLYGWPVDSYIFQSYWIVFSICADVILPKFASGWLTLERKGNILMTDFKLFSESPCFCILRQMIWTMHFEISFLLCYTDANQRMHWSKDMYISCNFKCPQ